MSVDEITDLFCLDNGLAYKKPRKHLVVKKKTSFKDSLMGIINIRFNRMFWQLGIKKIF